MHLIIISPVSLRIPSSNSERVGKRRLHNPLGVAGFWLDLLEKEPVYLRKLCAESFVQLADDL